MNADRRLLLHATGLAALAALGAAVWLLGVQERVRQRDALASARAALDSRHAQLETQQAELATLRQRLAGARADAARVDEVVTSVREQNVVLGRITRLAADHELAVDQVEPRGVEAVGRHEVLKVHVSGRGAFPDVVAYLAKLHGELRNVEVDTWTLEGRPLEEDFSGRFELDLAWHMEPMDPGAD